MKTIERPQGVVVPMVTPVTADGDLDVASVDRLVDFLMAGGVDGIFVLGTTGEGMSVPLSFRHRLVERTAVRVAGRVKVYAGIGDLHPNDAAAGNDHLQAGADIVVVRPPVDMPLAELEGWFRSLLDQVHGPLILYNMPATTRVSIPLDVIERLQREPQVVGIKDSENNVRRLRELLQRFGGKEDFSVFVGVGALMAEGLERGAAGIVPSVGNLIPEVCHRVWQAAQHGDWPTMRREAARMNAVAALYQSGRTLGQSLAALKAALACRGLCGPHVLSPLQPLAEREHQSLRQQMKQLHLLEAAAETVA